MTYFSKSTLLFQFLTVLVTSACTANPPQESCSPNLACSTTPPNRDKAVAHFKQHVTYPATREQILAACAHSAEFAEPEKQWLADNLPAGSYANADVVIRTLKL